MKYYKALSSVLLLFTVLSINCASSLTIDKKTYEPYGLLNKEENYSEVVTYKKRKNAIVLSILFCETLIVPFVELGYKLYEPDTLK